MQRSGRAKSEVKAPADAEVPAIEATDDPKKGGQQASNDAEPPVGAAAQAPADDEAGQQDATETANDGVSNVEAEKTVDGDGTKTAGDGGEHDA